MDNSIASAQQQKLIDAYENALAKEKQLAEVNQNNQEMKQEIEALKQQQEDLKQ